MPSSHRCSPRRSVRQHRFRSRPQLELLEERLPPGDALSLLLGWPRLEGSPPASELTFPLADQSSAQLAVRDELPSTLPAAGVLSAPRAIPIVSPAPATARKAHTDETTTGPSLFSALTPAFGSDHLWQAASTAASFRPAAAVIPPQGAVGFAAANPGFSGARPVSGGAAGTAGIVHGSDSLGFAALIAPPLGSAPPSPPAASDPPASSAGVVQARFELDGLSTSAFPSNRWTVADASQNTGVRINLPLPDATTRPSDRQDVEVLNTLDGFNLQPRLSIPFDGPIDPHSVSSASVFLVSLQDPFGKVIGIDQVVWDTATNTLSAESDELLAQHSRYLLVVTSGVRGADDQPVAASPAFQDLLQVNFDITDPPERLEYQALLRSYLWVTQRIGVVPPDDQVVTASFFTTQSTTAVLEKIRDQIKAATPAPADFLLGPDGTRTVFSFTGPQSRVTGITFNQQTRTTGALAPTAVNLSLLQTVPDAVGQVAFGKYVSPDYVLHPEEFIPPVATHTGVPVVQGTNEVYFNLFLPSVPKPEGGWPVAIFGTGGLNNKNQQPFNVAGVLAGQGIATVSINAVGLGFGPLGTLTVNHADGASVTFPAGGRGVDQNGDGTIGAQEGQNALAPRTILGNRDAFRQTTADLMQLVRVIEQGMDVEGDGSPDVDPSRIYYVGHSQGGLYGTMLTALEPNVRAGAFASAAPGLLGNRLGNNRDAEGTLLSRRVPSLLNPPGVTQLNGLAISMPRFHENLPLRDGEPLAVRLADGTNHVIQSPVVNSVPGAIAIQEVFENREWAFQAGNPVAYAPHLRKSPLPGVSVKPVIYQFGTGDQTAPNPAMTAVLRAGDLADSATLLRNDLAIAEDSRVPRDPHNFLVSSGSNVPLVREIALGAQNQIAAFFASDGAVVIPPSPGHLFETPIQGPLPEGLQYNL